MTKQIKDFNFENLTFKQVGEINEGIQMGNSFVHAVRLDVINEYHRGHVDIFVDAKKKEGLWRFVEYREDGDREYYREDLNTFTVSRHTITSNELLQYVAGLVKKYHDNNCKIVDLSRWEPVAKKATA